MNKTNELLILENNALINLSDEEANEFLNEEALTERRKLIDRLNQLTKELENE
ncbi:MAG: hypothetical protein HRU18_01170 [Pseudoalteromonas sp.]|uniref:hypothetical protein n=1 Tax=Pseudoalteromonas sp. TaxID=53249 RepID=UPI001D3CD61D|nr:hypothetical protein [Pseudoalteromonas sp.]NRA76790.1 hypothetical protein [Pseudoalteromonas sp.]